MAAILGSVETQRNGVCYVVYGVDGKVGKEEKDFKVPKASFLGSMGFCFNAIPMLVTAVHFVYNDIRLRPFMFLYQVSLGRSTGARFKMHQGTLLSATLL